jgi:hypothetical protein
VDFLPSLPQAVAAEAAVHLVVRLVMMVVVVAADPVEVNQMTVDLLYKLECPVDLLLMVTMVASVDLRA